jgi:hypothetical protein
LQQARGPGGGRATFIQDYFPGGKPAGGGFPRSDARSRDRSRRRHAGGMEGTQIAEIEKYRRIAQAANIKTD